MLARRLAEEVVGDTRCGLLKTTARWLNIIASRCRTKSQALRVKTPAIYPATIHTIAVLEFLVRGSFGLPVSSKDAYSASLLRCYHLLPYIGQSLLKKLVEGP
jgi:hypothetical protein